MAVCITALNALCKQQKDTTKAVGHITHSLRLVNARLSGSHAVSNENMAAVMVMWLYEWFRGRHQCSVHFDGLVRMADLRGGVAEIGRTTPKLAQKLLR